MNRNKSSAQYLANSSVPIREVLSVFLLAVICCSFTATASRPPEKEIPYRITLQTRAFVPEPGIDPALAEDVVMRLDRGQTSHVYVQLYGPLDGCQHADLEAQGVKLLAYIGNNTWCASLFVPSTAYLKDLAVVAASPALAAVRWMGPILPEDKTRQAQNEQLLVQAGVHSRRTAMDTLGVRNPNAEFDRWLDERRQILAMNQDFRAQSTRGGARERAVAGDMEVPE